MASALHDFYGWGHPGTHLQHCLCSAAAAAAGDTPLCLQSSARPLTAWWMGVCDVELCESDIYGGNIKNPSVCWPQDRWLNSGKLWVCWIIWGSSVCLASPGPLCQDWLRECVDTQTHTHTECAELVILHIPAPSSWSNGQCEWWGNESKSAGCVISDCRSTWSPSLAPGSSLTLC